ncbi:hypothetical protein ES703_68793 [subsurface metagenome]
MNISTIIAKALGIILLLVWLVFIPVGRVCFRQMRGLLFWEPTDNLNEKLKLWLEQAGHFQKIPVSIMHKAIIRACFSLSAGRDYIRQMGAPRCDQLDNFLGRVMYSMYIITFRWYILPFIVAVGLILSGSLWVILVLPIAWILSVPPFFSFFMYLLVIVSGWVYGGLIFSYFSSTSKLWYYTSRAMGVVFMFIACTIIMAILGLQKLCRTVKASERLRVDSE